MQPITEYDRWLQQQVQFLQERNFDSLDIGNLIEELEALGRAEKSAVKSLCYQILVHLLLIDYWSEQEGSKGHWAAEIDSFRFQLEDKLTTNYRQLLELELPRIYGRARRYAIGKSGLKSDRFPADCPYKIDDILEN